MLRVSVILPALNEAEHLRGTLLRLLAETHEAGDEIIVVDGGSHDDTCLIAEQFAHCVVRSSPGRAIQMNAGARVATGDVLLFLHADTLLPTGGLQSIRDALTDARNVGGAFRLGIDLAGVSIRIVEKTVNLRSRMCKCPYGDQGLFIRRDAFEQLNGYQNWPIMEDIDLVRRMRKVGRLRILKQYVTTSARRWAANGVWRTTLVNWTAIAMYLFGRSPQAIRDFYNRRLSDRTQKKTTTQPSSHTPPMRPAKPNALPASLTTPIAPESAD